MNTIKINQKKYELSEDSLIGFGSEGSIYSLSNTECIKKYDEVWFKDKLKQQKILALCQERSNFESIPEFDQIAFPSYVAYGDKNGEDEICGFSMKTIPNAESFIYLKYDLFDQEFKYSGLGEKKAEKIVSRLFEIVYFAHSEKIILGDIHPENVMIDSKTLSPYLIDFDSVKFGNFECSTNGIGEYVCPSILRLGSNINNQYVFSVSSDLFALTVVCFEFLVGVRPFSLSVSPIADENTLKLADISYLSFLDENDSVNGYQISDKQLFLKVKNRLNQIKANCPNIYGQFINVLVNEKRTYLSKKTIVKRRAQTIQNQKIIPIRGYKISEYRNDPKEFISFLERFNLTLPA